MFIVLDLRKWFSCDAVSDLSLIISKQRVTLVSVSQCVNGVWELTQKAMTRFRISGDFYPISGRKMDRQSADVLLLSILTDTVSLHVLLQIPGTPSCSFCDCSDFFFFQKKKRKNVWKMCWVSNRNFFTKLGICVRFFFILPQTTRIIVHLFYW